VKEKGLHKEGYLSFRLPKGVVAHESEKSFQLVRHFPLKTIFLHKGWIPVMTLLSGGQFIPLEEILIIMKGPDPEKIEFLLNDLVRKGFLEQEGFSALPDYPTVSVIIPVRNRPRELESCLLSLGKLDYPDHKLEIIVVDDASTDHTPRIVSDFPARLISVKKRRQAPYCRNLAAKQANGEILAFIDSDCLADPLWLKELLSAFKDSRVAGVGGRVASWFEKTPLDRYEGVKSSLIMGKRFARSQENEKFFYVPSCNLLIRKNLFLELGGFKEELFVGEDVDLCWRMQDAGHLLEFRPVGTVFHKHRNRIKPFCLRRFDYGTSEPLLQKLHKSRGKKMVFPLGSSLFWSMGILALVFKYPIVLSLCAIIVIGDTLNKCFLVRRKNIPIKTPVILVSVLRGYFAHFYHFCAFVSRYYLIWSIPALFFSSLAFGIIWCAHILTAITEYMIKKPQMNFFTFLFYFSLEQLFYQLGVWWGCIRYRSFQAVNPQLALKIPSKVT
jgi:mycofactocin system glycosyltransferase